MNRILFRALLFLCPWVALAQSNPAPYALSGSNYSLTDWFSGAAAGTYPASMVFQTCTDANPALATATTGNYSGVYNGSSGVRFNGLSSGGFYLAGALNASPSMGAAVLALNTVGRSNISLSWQNSTFLAGNPAAARLQYRISSESSWLDVPGPVEYAANGSTSITPVPFSLNLSTLLGDNISNRSSFQLRWKYYRTSGSGANDCAIAFDEILVSSTANPSPSIGTGLMATVSYCVSPTVGTSTSLPFQYAPVASFQNGSVFTVQMSNASGSFTSPVTVGQINCDGSGSQTAPVTIPSNTATGTGYRFRVVHALSATTGNDNTVNITINLVPVPVTSVTTNARYKKALIGWTNPGFCWDEVLVLARYGSLPSGTPAGNGSLYTANANYGQGSALGDGFVVYKGTGNQVEMAGLVPEISYGFTIWTRRGSDWISAGTYSVLTPELAALNTKGLKITSAEYFWNNDPGAGNGVAFSVEDGNYNQAFERIFRNGLQAPKRGRNSFNVRVRDADAQWSAVFSTIIHVDSVDTYVPWKYSNPVQAEYWWNSDPGVGNASPMLALDGNLGSAFERMFANGLTAPRRGQSTFNVRVKDNLGIWSNPFSTIVRVDSVDTYVPWKYSNPVQAEFWWNSDPGVGNASPMLALDGNLGSAFERLFANGLTAPRRGQSSFNVRVKDNLGVWSNTFSTIVRVDSVDTYVPWKYSNPVQAEYWWNSDPGVGNASPMLALDGNLGTAFERLFVNGIQAPKKGRNTFNVRLKDDKNVWSSAFTTIVQVDSNDIFVPYFITQRIKQQEFFWDTDPGEGNGTYMPASDGFANSAFEKFSVKPNYNQVLPNGVHLLGVRARDAAGTWGPVFKTTVDVNFQGNAFAVYTNPAYAVRCTGQSVTLNALGGVSYTWSPSTGLNTTTGATVIATPSVTTTYTVTGTNGSGLVATATVTVEVSSPGGIAGPSERSLCPGQSLQLSSVSPFGIFWSTGQSAQTITVNQPGIYSLITENGCGTQVNTVKVNPAVTPTFAAVGPYCSGAAIPALPTTSTNGITGNWSPAINNTTTTTYTFTPSVGQCGSTTTLTITINPQITPAFAAVGPYCSGSTIPALPTTSTNGITGNWSPAISNTATTTYTFTPTAGQCANTTTLSITITPKTTPAFAAVGPYCSGATIPALPTTSTNGITGNWSPAINNTATTTYTFTPTGGQCASATTLTITVSPSAITPTFAAVGPYCSGAAIPALPTTSTNGITGNWSPAINNTTTTTYTFTPNAGQCAGTATLTITVNPGNVTPAFAAVGPYCSGATIPALPTTSTNGITGNWSPAINNTTTTTYTFAPNAGQCASTTTLTITVNPSASATVSASGTLNLCTGGSVTLSTPVVSGQTYAWRNNGTAISGATSNSYTASAAGSYTVTVTTAAGCPATSSASVVTMNSIPATPATLTGPTMICTLTSGTYTAGAVTGAVSYTWTLPSGLTGTSTTNSINVAINDANFSSGAVTVRANTAFCTSAARSLTIAKVPATPATLSGSPTVTCDITSGSYTCAASTGATQYNWTLPAGFSGTSTTTSIATTINNTTFTSGNISVRASNTCGTSAARTLAVSKVPFTPATITGPTLTCGLTSATYTASTGSNVSSYTWTLPAGITGTSTTNTITVSINNTVFASGSISVKANNSCGSSAAKTLALSRTPSSPTAITGPTQLCGLTTATYTCTAMTGATSYNWVLPAGLTGTSTTNSITVAVNPSLFTSGSVSVQAVNSCGSSAAKTLALTKVLAASATLSGPAFICGLTTATYTATAVTGATSYNWVLPAGLTGTSTTNTITVTVNPANYTSGSVSVAAVNACGTGTSKTLALSKIPATPTTLSGPDAAVCAGSTQTYSCSATTNASSYTWTVPTGAVINSGQGTSSISVTFPSTFASGTVSVTANSACGSSTAKSLAVASRTAQPGTISGTSTNLCAGGTFAYSIAAVTGATSYSWTVPTGCSFSGASTGTSVSLVVPAGFTSGTLSVVANNACGASTARTLAISGAPSATTTLTGPASVCPSAAGLVYSTAAVTGATSYTWTVPTGASITAGSGTSSITVKWGTVAGSVTVKAGNTCGTNATAKTLAVALAACRTAGEEPSDEIVITPEVLVYPNPGKNIFHLQTKGIEAAKLQVRDVLGREVLSREMNASESSVDLGSVPFGTYFFHITAEGYSKVVKVIKN